ncbi:tensin-like isoform X3 [Acropora millepora]|nr:tensin-like isoform X3 [Acropora millepora]
MVKGQSAPQGSMNTMEYKSKTLLDDKTRRKQAPSSKSLVSNICHHVRHRVSRNRVRHVDEHFDLDLTYITERIIAMSFPGSGLETTYRNNLREVAKLLQRNHQDKYMVFNLSERRYDISKLNHQVLDFGWPDHLAPPLERLWSIIKSIDSWLKTDPLHVVVVHCKGGKGRTGVVIAAYMHFSKICSSPSAALDWFAMKRFYDDSLGGVTQPSQRRYVHYFSDYLDSKVKLNTDPIFLHHVIIHGIPSFDTRGGCKPFLRVYEGLKLIYTSGVFHVTPDMERICITIEGGLILRGDVLIKCYHKNTLSSGRDIIFRCQFYTGAIKDHGLVLEKTELDDACKEKRFPDDCRVEFVFSATGNFVSEIKHNERLRSIIRHSLLPMENPDTVLYPEIESWYDSPEGNAESATVDGRNTKEDCKPDITNFSLQDKTSPKITGKAGTLKRPPEYVAGPVNGQLYAQVDRAFKKRVRSLSLGSGSHFSNQEELPFFERKANTLTRKNAYGVQNKESALTDVKLSHPRLQYITADEMECSRSRSVLEDELKSMDLLLEELGGCSTLQHTPSRLDGLGLSDSGGVTGGSRSLRPPGVPVRNAASFDAGSRYNRNGTTGFVPNGFVSSAHTSNATSLPSPFQYSGNSIPNGYIGKPPRETSSSVILHEPPLTQTSPPLSPLSPKFYATQMTPRTFKAKTVTHTTLGYNPTRPALDAAVRNGSTNSQAAKQTGGTRVFDFNNNTPTNSIGFSFDMDDRKEIEDSQTLPEKGNVKSKIALLTDMLQTDKEQQVTPHQLLKCQIIPMPGLTDVSPSDVFKEISSYNAQSLAPGELSQSTGTLYSSKAPPKRIIEPSKHVVSLEPSIEDIDYVAVKDSLKHITLPDLTVNNQKTDSNGQYFVHKSPSTRVDGISEEEGFEIKSSIDDRPTNLGVSSPSVCDSAFGESTISMSPVSTPVSELSSNRLNQMTTEVREEFPSADQRPNQQIIDLNFMENTGEQIQEAKEDEEAGYARLEDIRQEQQKRIQTSGVATETVAFLDGTRSFATRGAESNVEEQLEFTSATNNMEAIENILMEMNDMSLIANEPPQPSRSSTPQSYVSGGMEARSPAPSSESGVFDNSTQRKKSQPHSDKGYGSTTSVSSGSSGDNVFLPNSPKIPGLKFDRDTSGFWYKPSISRNEAIAILRNAEPGRFVIRDSQSFPGAFGLAVKVAVPPAHVLQGLQGDMSKVDLDNELVRHFLIETTKKGVRLKGIEDEPVFGSLAAFVYQHSITPLALPIRLSMPSQDLLAEDKSQATDSEDGHSWPNGAVGSLMYLGLCDVEMLTGATAVERAVERLSSDEAAKQFTTVGFKVTPAGMTVTDNERKVFFRRHFHMKSILFCGMDPGDKRWDLKTPTYSGKSKSFGVVLRKTGGVHNECHLFGEICKDWPSSILVNILNRFMTSST